MYFSHVFFLLGITFIVEKIIYFPWHFNINMWDIFFILNMMILILYFVYYSHFLFTNCLIVTFYLHVIEVVFEPQIKDLLHHLELLCKHSSSLLYILLLDEQSKHLCSKNIFQLHLKQHNIFSMSRYSYSMTNYQIDFSNKIL